MRSQDRFPFHGHVVWLTAEQGGRKSGPPNPPDGSDYVPNAYVPPHGLEGLASIVLRVQDRTAWCSPAAARWLVLDNVGAQEIRPGSVVVITEGPRSVAYFHVTEVIDEQ